MKTPLDKLLVLLSIVLEISPECLIISVLLSIVLEISPECLIISCLCVP
jgi:hypothetical protein